MSKVTTAEDVSRQPPAAAAAGSNSDQHVPTDIRAVVSGPSDGLGSLVEQLYDHESGPDPGGTRETTPAHRSVVLPSSTNRFVPGTFVGQHVPFVFNRLIKSYCNNEYGLYEPNENACALLISGCDKRDVAFTQTCERDVSTMAEILSEPKGIIPKDNVFLITPHKNFQESDIEKIYSAITAREPEVLYFGYSGHGAQSDGNTPRSLPVSDFQGNALAISRIQQFITGLLPRCNDLVVTLDCCQAGAAANLILPMLSAGFMTNRFHVQWASCKGNGTSFLGENSCSLFTDCIISGLGGGLTATCPNQAENCPICSEFRTIISRQGYIILQDITEYVNEHMKHKGTNDKSGRNFSRRNLPVLMINPEARQLTGLSITGYA